MKRKKEIDPFFQQKSLKHLKKNEVVKKFNHDSPQNQSQPRKLKREDRH